MGRHRSDPAHWADSSTLFAAVSREVEEPGAGPAAVSVRSRQTPHGPASRPASSLNCVPGEQPTDPPTDASCDARPRRCRTHEGRAFLCLRPNHRVGGRRAARGASHIAEREENGEFCGGDRGPASAGPLCDNCELSPMFPARFPTLKGFPGRPVICAGLCSMLCYTSSACRSLHVPTALLYIPFTSVTAPARVEAAPHAPADQATGGPPQRRAHGTRGRGQRDACIIIAPGCIIHARRMERPPASLSPDWLIRARPSTPVPTADEPVVGQIALRSGPSPLVVDVHDGIEVGVMLAGTAERHFQDFIVPGKPGDVWLCAMWEPHGRRVISTHTENVVLQFIPEFLGEEPVGDKSWLTLFAVAPSERPWVSTPEVRSEVLEIGRQMRREVQDKARSWEYAVRLLLLRLLFSLSRDWDPPERSVPVGRSATLVRVMPALSLLRDPRRPRVTLGDAADACRLSQSRFAVLFRQMIGITFAKFALRARLAFAAHRLLSTDLSVEDIATEAHFTDASHLHRHFVRHYGRTPARYRDQPTSVHSTPDRD